MKRSQTRRFAVVASVLALLAASPAGANGSHRWSRAQSSTSIDGALSTAITPDGDVYVSGICGSSFNAGGTAHNCVNGDAFIAKYSGVTGGFLWSKTWGSNSNDQAYGVTTDADGNAIVVGSYAGSVVIAGKGVTSVSGTLDIFVAKIPSSGGPALWVKSFGGTASEEATSVATTSNGDIVLAGWTGGPLTFGGISTPAFGGQDLFVARLQGSDGLPLWVKRYGSAQNERALAVAVTPEDDVIAAGRFPTSLSLGGTTLLSTGGTDIWISRIGGTTGAHQWSQSYGGSLDDDVSSVAVDRTGTIAMTGLFRGTAGLGLAPLTSAGGADIFLASYAGDGSHRWSERFGASGGDAGKGVAYAADGEVLLTGSFSGSVDFGGGALTSAGGTDVVVGAYDGATGAHDWSRRYGNSGNDEGAAIAVHPLGNVSVVGRFEISINFGGSTLSASGLSDSFAASLTSVAPAIPVTETGSTAVAEGGPSDTYSVVLSEQPTANVTVSASDPAGQIALSPSTLLFTPANWNTPQTVTVSAIDDATTEPFERTTTVSHTATSFDANYNGLAVSSVLVTVQDNDDTTAPTSSFTSVDPTVATTPPLAAGSVDGASIDDSAGVASVSVTYDPVAAPLQTGPLVITAQVSCDVARIDCTWTAGVPSTPGVYTATARATDREGNVEIGSVPIKVIVA